MRAVPAAFRRRARRATLEAPFIKAGIVSLSTASRELEAIQSSKQAT
jgi:hypothetical protein